MKRSKERKAFELSEVGLHLSANLTFEAVKPKRCEKSEEQVEERRKKALERKKARRKELYAKGVCWKCKKAPADNGYSCASCRAKPRERKRKSLTEEQRQRGNAYEKETYYWLKFHHICTKCKKEKAYRKRSLCFECLLKARERAHKRYLELKDTESYKKYRKNKSADQYADRCARGICVYCGKSAASKGLIACASCRIFRNIRKHEKYVNNLPDTYFTKEQRKGILCWWCNAPTLDGKCYCPSCLKKMSENMRRNWEKGLYNNVTKPIFVFGKKLYGGGKVTPRKVNIVSVSQNSTYGEKSSCRS